MLTTAERVGAYMGIAGVTSSTAMHIKLDRLARSASDFVEGYLCRTVRCVTKTASFPVPNMQSKGVVIPDVVASLIGIDLVSEAGTTPQDLDNYHWEQYKASSELWLWRGSWPNASGRKPIQVRYRTGHLADYQGIVAASITVPNLWLEDAWVTIDGVEASATTNAPSAGQYRVSNGVYAFHASDAGKPLVIKYAHVPPAIEQAVIDLTAFADAAAGRIGLVSKSLGGSETVSFSQQALTPAARLMLGPYKATFS